MGSARGAALAKLYQSTGRPAEAHAVLAPALEGFAPTPEMPEIAEAQALLGYVLAHVRRINTAGWLSAILSDSRGCAMGETRKLAAILVADVVGYSRLAGADEDRTLARLRGLRSDLIDPAIAAHHGRIVKRTGDGSIIEFRSVVDAVRCAIEVQTGMVERNAGCRPNAASSSASAFISATSSRRPTAT